LSESSPPTLVFILGPAAVGKMTVGQELAKLTGYRLLYNHMVVDLVTKFFPFGTPGFHRLARPFTLAIIEACADEGVSLIVTHGLLFDAPGSMAMLDDMARPYRDRAYAVRYAELSAPLDVRLARNLTPNRARHKDVSWSTEDRLREMDAWGRWHSEDELAPDERLSLDNADLPPADAARAIVAGFALPALSGGLGGV
jgi:hypothetical protein